MRFLPILLLIAFSCFTVEALKKRQLQQVHKGYCPMHMMTCDIYCGPFGVDFSATRENNGCLGDNECALEAKCCKPACGCMNKCTKALEKPGFGKP